MDIDYLEALSMTAKDLLSESSWGKPWGQMHGVELAEGFFNVYNEVTGQSKMVVLHEESGYIWKRYYAGASKWTASGTYIGTVQFEEGEYRIRIPRFHVFGDIVAQEWINSDSHVCHSLGDYGSCDHVALMRSATGYFDTHVGNWKIHHDEVVLFDFD